MNNLEEKIDYNKYRKMDLFDYVPLFNILSTAKRMLEMPMPNEHDFPDPLEHTKATFRYCYTQSEIFVQYFIVNSVFIGVLFSLDKLIDLYS